MDVRAAGLFFVLLSCCVAPLEAQRALLAPFDESYDCATDPVCLKCHPKKPQCNKCKEGYFKALPDDRTCVPCSQASGGCLTCSPSGSECFSCAMGYQLTSDASGSATCVCAPGFGGAQCEQCLAGTYSSNGECLPCGDGWTSLAGSSNCEPCSDVSGGCLSCSLSECFSCDEGYQLSSGTCVPCSQVVLWMTVDDKWKVYYDGDLLGSGNYWHAGGTYSFCAILGEPHVIAIAGSDVGGDAGMVAKMQITHPDGLSTVYISDASWKVFESELENPGELPSNWNTAAFDDSGWDSPSVWGQYGDPPWSRFGSGTVASLEEGGGCTTCFWLWGPTGHATRGHNPQIQHKLNVWFRKTFS